MRQGIADVNATREMPVTRPSTGCWSRAQDKAQDDGKSSSASTVVNQRFLGEKLLINGQYNAQRVDVINSLQ
jgi:hypothetical protein